MGATQKGVSRQAPTRQEQALTEHEYETGKPSKADGNSVPVPPFRITLSSSCEIDDLVALDGESTEHARADATTAILEAFHAALGLINDAEGTTFSVFDFQITTLPI
jgi:hypothetical protein